MPSLSIVVPAYNEASRLAPTLDATLSYLARTGASSEVIVVDDGSKDATAVLVERYAAADPRVRLVRLASNRGKGAAVRAGVLASRGDRVLVMDADGSTPIEELAALDAACDRGAAVAVGSRRSEGARVERSPFRSLASWLFAMVLRILVVDLVGEVRDTQCGFKLFRGDVAREVFARATIDRFAFDVEILALARRRARIAEVPVRWAHVAESKVRVLRDGLAMVRDVIRVRRAMRASLWTGLRQLARATA